MSDDHTAANTQVCLEALAQIQSEPPPLAFTVTSEDNTFTFEHTQPIERCERSDEEPAVKINFREWL